MTHEELRDQLLDLACGELSPSAARTVEAHAASCETCRAELARMLETRRMMSALPPEPAPAGGERVLLAAAREAAQRREPRRTFPRWLWGASVVAASLVAVAAISVRVASMRSAAPGREDRNAILGDSPYARAPVAKEAPPQEEAPPREEPKERADAAPPSLAERHERSRAAPAPQAPSREEPARRKRSPALPPREDAEPTDSPGAEGGALAPPRFATPPPPASPSGAARATGATAEKADAEAAPPSGTASRAPSAPPPAAAAAPRPAPSRAAPSRAPNATARVPEASPEPPSGAGPDAVARYEALRAAGRLRAEERTFPGCPHELWRRVERDPEGRVVSYAWVEMAGTQRLRFEAVYGPDGKLVRKQAFDAETSAPEPMARFRVPPVSSIDIDAPPRCGG